MKKILSLMIVAGMLNFTFLPVYSSQSTNAVINAQFSTELNVNKASKGEVVQFVTLEDNNVNGFIIPQGTIFSGKVKSLKKSRWAYRRAKVRIVINEMILPTGEKYSVKGITKRHVLKGSAIGNVTKGIVTLPVALVVGTAGACVIIVETISIVGLIIVGPTSYLVGQAMGKLTHGVNCKKHEGNSIKLRIKSMPNIQSTNNQTDELIEY